MSACERCERGGGSDSIGRDPSQQHVHPHPSPSRGSRRLPRATPRASCRTRPCRANALLAPKSPRGGGLIFPQAFIFGAKHFCFSLYNLVSLKSCKCVALGSGGTTHLELGGLPVAVVAVTTTGKQHEWSQVKHGITAAKDRDLNLVRSSTSYPHPANTNIADSPVNARKGQN